LWLVDREWRFSLIEAELLDDGLEGRIWIADGQNMYDASDSCNNTEHWKQYHIDQSAQQSKQWRIK